MYFLTPFLKHGSLALGKITTSIISSPLVTVLLEFDWAS